MKIISYIAVLLVSCFLVQSSSAASAGATKSGKLMHVVSFKFKDSATPAQIKELVEAFGGLKKKIPQVQSFEWGTNVSPEHLNKGFTHCFVLTFKTDKARDEYLVHPEHKIFGSKVGPIVADVMVIDFWSTK